MLQVGVGFLAQYIIKPLLGFVIALVKFLLAFVYFTFEKVSPLYHLR